MTSKSLYLGGLIAIIVSTIVGGIIISVVRYVTVSIEVITQK